MTTGRLRRFALGTGMTGLAVLGVAAAAAPASAGTNCAPGYHCVFYYNFDGPRKSYFNSDPNFTDDFFEGTSINVNDQNWSASNSSTQGYESHYYRDINYGGGLLFCVNPGHSVNGDQLSGEVKDEASSLRLRPTTTIHCF